MSDKSHNSTQQRLTPEADLKQRRYRSERKDRIFVRRALRRGVPAEDIENRLMKATEFHRLNPELDMVLYVRQIIDEEGNGLQKLDMGEINGKQGTEPQQRPEARDAHSEEIARRYIQENYQATDRLAVVIRNRHSGETLQRITTAENLASSEYQSWLRHKNAHGSDIYLSLNTLKEEARGRTKEDLGHIRHLYLDLDVDGRNKLGKIYQDSSLPHPNYVLNTSPGKYQVIWRVHGIAKGEAEQMLRNMAAAYGGDPAATDATRVFRLPGFNNKKYDADFAVTVSPGSVPDAVYQLTDFKISTVMREATLLTPAGRKGEQARTQSERDWAYAIRHLQRGEAPEAIVRQITEYRSSDRVDEAAQNNVASQKVNPHYYASHTVSRAMAYLGIRTNHSPSDGSLETESPTTEPDR